MGKEHGKVWKQIRKTWETIRNPNGRTRGS